jgi:uncharacterized membrane protein YeaQ/YmgE (transglycosylase-associated protein family)
MNTTRLSILLSLAAGPALAQEGAAEAVGTGLGLVIGLLIMIVVGAIVGWLASLIVKGSGSGFWGDVLVGIGGSVLAGFLFPLLGIETGTSILTAFIPAVIGAAILLLIVRVIRRGAG